MTLPDSAPVRPKARRGRPKTLPDIIRTSIALEPTAYVVASKFCVETDVSFSAYVRALVEADLRARGLLR